jgi:hypothetical protein
LKDLPAVDLTGVTDRFARLELGLPFTRTLINVFEVKLNAALKNCGDEGYVTLAALRKELDTQAWAALENPSSDLHKMLSSAAFKADGQGAD